MLHLLDGVPLIIHTLRRAFEAGCFDEIVCLTDARPIREAVEAAGYRALLTGPAANGTDRIGKYADLIRNDLIVDLQGDEPAFPPAALRLLARAVAEAPREVHVLVEDRALDAGERANPNRCKAGLDASGYVVDFYRREPRVPVAALSDSRLQLGAYAYHKDYLRRYAEIVPSSLELSESHELLRDLGLAPVRAHFCPFVSQAVDVPQDAERALALLRRDFQAAAPAAATA
jgi:3-deoxy-manno-octulosonate cytidylyltransferase (CMP-KDO synthetase)